MTVKVNTKEKETTYFKVIKTEFLNTTIIITQKINGKPTDKHIDLCGEAQIISY